MAITTNWISGIAYDDLTTTVWAGFNQIIVDNCGNYIMGGSSGGPTQIELPTIIKQNKNGSLIWSYVLPRNYDGSDNFSYGYISSLCVDSSDNIYSLVWLSSSLYAIMKLNKYGELIWYKRFQGTPSGDVRQIEIDSQGNLYILRSGTTITSFDSDGNLRWSQYVQGGDWCIAIVGNFVYLSVSGTGRTNGGSTSVDIDIFNKDTGAAVVRRSLELINTIPSSPANLQEIVFRKMVYDGSRYLYAVDDWYSSTFTKIDTVDFSVVWLKKLTQGGLTVLNSSNFSTSISYRNNRLYFFANHYSSNITLNGNTYNNGQGAISIGSITSSGTLEWMNGFHKQIPGQYLYAWWYWPSMAMATSNTSIIGTMTTSFGSPVPDGQHALTGKFPIDGSTTGFTSIGDPGWPYTYNSFTIGSGSQDMQLTDYTFNNWNIGLSEGIPYILPESSTYLMGIPGVTLSDSYNSENRARTYYSDGTNIGYIAANANARDIIDTECVSSGGNTSNGGSNTSNTGSNTSNISVDIPVSLYNLIGNTSFIQARDLIYNNGPNIQTAITFGNMMYLDSPNTYIEIYNLVNASNIELEMTKYDVRENLWVANSAVTFRYKNLTEILYLRPPASFFTAGSSNTGNTIEAIENYCCPPGEELIRDSYGNFYPPVTLDANCHGFKANDTIWQLRRDGRRVTGIVAKEDCANGTLYIDKATGLFQKNRDIYKDNGSITANVFAVFANTTGKITIPTQYIIDMPDYGPGVTTPLLPIYIDTSSNTEIDDSGTYYLEPNAIRGANNIPIGNVNEIFANSNLSYTMMGLKIFDYVNNTNNKALDIVASNGANGNANTNTRFTIDVTGGLTIIANVNNRAVFSVSNTFNTNITLLALSSNSFQTNANAVVFGKGVHTRSYAETLTFVRTVNGNLTIDLSNSHTFAISSDGTTVNKINIIKPSYNANVAYSATLIFGNDVNVAQSAWATANVQWPDSIKPNVANSHIIALLNAGGDNTWYGFGSTQYVFSNTGYGSGLGPNGTGYNFLWYNPTRSYTFTITNTWTSEGGTDLDTRTWLTVSGATPSWANVVLGWNYASSVNIGTPPTPYAQAAMTWSGDDTSSGGFERIVIPIDTAIASVPILYNQTNVAPTTISYAGANSIVGYSNTTTNVVSYTATSITNSILGNSGMTQISGMQSIDDTFAAINLPFPVTYAGTTYNIVYLSSNGYLTFQSGSAAYASLSATNPSLPKIFFFGGDRRILNAFYQTSGVAPNRTFRIRSENGVGAGSTTLGCVAEIIFYENSTNIDIHYDINGASGSLAGAYSNNSAYATWSNSPSTSFRIGNFSSVTYSNSTPIWANVSPVYTTVTDPYIDIHVGAFWYEQRGSGTFTFTLKNDVSGETVLLTPTVQHRNVVGIGLNKWATFRLYPKYLLLYQIS